MKIYGKVEIGSMAAKETARVWECMGAAGLYVRYAPDCEYEPSFYFETLKELVKAVKLPLTVEVRRESADDIKSILALGVERVVIGKEAVEDEMLIDRLLKEGRDKVSVLLDSYNGSVSPRSWVNVLEFSTYNFVGKLAEKGCRSVIYSDGSTACNVGSYDAIEKLCSLGRVKITLSGCPDSAEELLKLKNSGIDGFIMNSPDILRSYY